MWCKQWITLCMPWYDQCGWLGIKIQDLVNQPGASVDHSKLGFSCRSQTVVLCEWIASRIFFSCKWPPVSETFQPFYYCSFFIIISPLTVRVVLAPQMILQPVFSIFPVLHCPPLPLSALSSYPFHCALQDGFGQTWWTGDIIIPLQFASLYNHQEVLMWSSCLLDLGTDFLIGDMAFVAWVFYFLAW